MSTTPVNVPVHISRQAESNETIVPIGNGNLLLVIYRDSELVQPSLRVQGEHGGLVVREPIYRNFAYRLDSSTISFIARESLGQNIRYFLRLRDPLHAQQVARLLETSRSIAPESPESGFHNLVESELTRRGYRSHAVRKLKILRHGGIKKSGLTPISPWGPGNFNDPYRKQLIYQQNRWLQGYDTSQLMMLRAMAAYEDFLVSELLDNEIHPLYAIDNWEKSLEPRINLPLFEIGTQPGYWEASNECVWKILEPCLRLASQFISNQHCWPWWDALIFGELKDHLCSAPNLGKRRLSFHPRSAEEASQDRHNAQLFFLEKLCGKVRLNFIDGTASV